MFGTRTLGAAAVLLVAGLAACESTAAIAIITLTNTWHEESDPDHEFSLTDNTVDFNTPTESGTFTGTESVDGIDVADIDGSWAHGRVTMVVHRGGGDVTYTARFHGTNPDRLEFTSDDADDLVMVR